MSEVFKPVKTEEEVVVFELQDCMEQIDMDSQPDLRFLKKRLAM